MEEGIQQNPGDKTAKQKQNLNFSYVFHK